MDFARKSHLRLLIACALVPLTVTLVGCPAGVIAAIIGAVCSVLSAANTMGVFGEEEEEPPNGSLVGTPDQLQYPGGPLERQEDIPPGPAPDYELGANGRPAEEVPA